jgi:hypothetical protein
VCGGCCTNCNRGASRGLYHKILVVIFELLHGLGAKYRGYLFGLYPCVLGYILTFSWAISSSYILEAEDSCEFFI